MLAHLDSSYSGIAIYREWTFGRYTPPRQEQKADLRTDTLLATCENLALVLNKIRPKGRKRLLEALKALYPEIQDFNVQIEAGRVQLFLEEGDVQHSGYPAFRRNIALPLSPGHSVPSGTAAADLRGRTGTRFASRRITGISSLVG